MTALTSNNHTIHIRATFVARLYFTQEFGGELQDALKIIIDKDSSDEDIERESLKLIWAMNKAENKANGKSTLNFRQWFEQYNGLRFDDYYKDFLAEISNGFLIKDTGQATSEQTSDNFTQFLITIAIKLGISMDELNELTTQALFDILQIFADSNNGEDRNVVATPAQNEAFWR